MEGPRFSGTSTFLLRDKMKIGVSHISCQIFGEFLNQVFFYPTRRIGCQSEEMYMNRCVNKKVSCCP